MKLFNRFAAFGMLLLAVRLPAERINQEGRILGSLPVVTNSILFNTTNADTIVSAMQIFPVTNPWNEDISRRPVLVNSDAMIAQIIADLVAINPNRRTLRAFYEMNFVLVPDNQPRIPINFLDYPDESDLDGGTDPYGSYPIPSNLPIETWPHDNTNTLAAWQQDLNSDGGDRHAIIVQPGNGFIWEMWQAKRAGTNWEASNGAKFDLNSNVLRSNGWTSADAAGLAMFPALPRFDECERGMVEHACRIVVARSKYKTYIYPATHYAAPTNNTSTNLPSMGQRLRLKASYIITNSWTKQEKAVLLALKKYGAIVADNGNFFSISVTPDDRWPPNCFNHFNSLDTTNFEAIQTTGPNEGPRSPGAPATSAGADQTVSFANGANLQGFVNFTGTPPTNQWKLYSGPGSVTFGDATQTNSTASFSAPGVYTLMLSADDGVHAVTYDAVAITVTQAITLNIALVGTNVSLSWAGGASPFVVEQTDFLPASSWSGAVTTGLQTASVPRTSANRFFRVRGN
jgi:K319-like protein